MKRLDDKIALITGGTAGIGRAASIRLAAEGAHVIVTGRNSEAGEETLRLIRAAAGTGEFCRQDVTSADDWHETTRMVLTRHGRLDVLVNNAGSFFASPLESTSLEDFRSLWRTNVDSVFLGTQAAFRIMRQAGRGGGIINVASRAGLSGMENCSAYCASKAACIMFSRAAALEGTVHHIRVNVVAPGPVWTNMIAARFGDTDEVRRSFAESQPLKILTLPEDIAAGILYLASDAAASVNGTVLVIDAGRSAD